jgi:hypothetical protein
MAVGGAWSHAKLDARREPCQAKHRAKRRGHGAARQGKSAAG